MFDIETNNAAVAMNAPVLLSAITIGAIHRLCFVVCGHCKDGPY
jgi:hypothetical protein